MRILSRPILAVLLLFTAAAQAAPNGTNLYVRNCAACHGIDGRGGVGVPLSLPDFLSTVDNDYLKQTIRLGRPGRVMPAFEHFSDAEIDAIVGHLRSWDATPAPDYTPLAVAGDVTRGAAIYAQRCASCHGANGEGGTGTGVTFSRPRDLPIVAPALNNPGYLAAASDTVIKATLERGRTGTPMVSFKEHGLSEQDIVDVVRFVRSFAERPLPQDQQPMMVESPTLVFESPYDLPTTVSNIERAAQGMNFRLIRTQKLDQGLVPEGQEDSRQAMIYFCNFDMLNDALAVDPRVGLFLPCRVTAIERNGKVLVMAVNPKRLSQMFNNARLNRLCTQMHDTYVAILEEATL